MIKMGKSNEEFQQIIKQGWKVRFALPEFETVEKHGGLGKGAITGAGIVFGGLAGGLIGYAISNGNKTKQREINTVARVADKGIVVQQAAPDSSDLRIPWESIVSINPISYSNDYIEITLVNGFKFNLAVPYNGFFFTKYYTDEFVAFVNEHAKGQPEDGW